MVRALSTGLSLLLFALALAQPQCGSRAELTKRRGIDVVVALDASKSMRARDVLPSRLDRAKLELSTLLDELKGDRVAIVAFAGEAFIQCPLTSDYAAAKLFLRAIDPDQMQEGGTNIGAALQTAKQVLDGADRGAKDRVVVLLSDGEDLSGEVGEATEALKAAGIKVFTVGIGNAGGEPIPVLDKQGDRTGYLKDPSTGQTVLSRLDEAGLEAIAQATGGEYFHRTGAVAVPEVAARIDRLQKSELESRITVRYDERFQAFLLPGLVLLVLGMLVGARWQRRGSAGLLGAVLLLLLPGRRGRWAPSRPTRPCVERGLKAYDDGPVRGRAPRLHRRRAGGARASGAGVQPRQRALPAGAVRRGTGRVPAGRGRSGPVPPGARPLQHGQRAGAARRHAGGHRRLPQGAGDGARRRGRAAQPRGAPAQAPAPEVAIG